MDPGKINCVYKLAKVFRAMLKFFSIKSKINKSKPFEATPDHPNRTFYQY